MVKVAIEHVFTGPTATSYDKTKTTLSPHMRQLSLSAAPQDKFAGPLPISIARPQEQSVAIPALATHVIDYSTTKQWVFYADHANAATTRRIGLYEFDKPTGAYSWRGYVTLTPPPGTNQQIRGFRMLLSTYSTGTVAVSGTAVTGSGTAWQTAGLAVGARIGFGSTDPQAISTWYQITAIASDGSITLGSSAGTISAGTAFVIEELRCAMACTAATATNGGLFLAKGLNVDIFLSTGTTIPAATTVDNIRATYWLKDASTETNTVAAGLCTEAPIDASTHYCYVPNGSATNLIIYKYNLRAPLTGLASGATTVALVLITGTAVVTGNISQHNNGRIGTLSHGPGSGVSSMYLVTTTRVYRIAMSGIVAASTTYLTDNMTEQPPGTVNTYAATAGLISLEICDSIDRLLISTGQRQYLTRYNTIGSQFDRIFSFDTRQLDQGTADAGTVPSLSWSNLGLSGWVEAGYAHLVRTGTGTGPSSTLNQIFAVPIGADWDHGEMIITPELPTPGAKRYYRSFANNVELVGSDALGVSPEPFKMFYRTAGIDDNSGAWMAINAAGDLSGVGAAASIQFALTFRVVSGGCIPARIMGLGLCYDTDDSLPSELQWSLADSTNLDGTVGMTQVAVFAALATLSITYYRSDTNAAVLVQDSGSTTNGVWEYWTGSAWAAGLGSNAIGQRRRFRPTAGLPTGVDTYAKVTAT